MLYTGRSYTFSTTLDQIMYKNKAVWTNATLHKNVKDIKYP